MDKLERLLNLTAALLHASRPLTAQELRKRVGGYPEAKAAFRRTFERDKDDLRSMGIPLRVEAVSGTDPPIDGYRILRSEYTGHNLQFEPDELTALNMATNAVRLDGGATGLHKLGGSTTQLEAAEIGRVPFNEKLALLITAAAEGRTVGFTYADLDRLVEPWRLSFVKGHWYLAGWDCIRHDQRLYRVDRIASQVELRQHATQPRATPTDPAKLRMWELGDEEPQRVRVMVDSDHVAYFCYLMGEDPNHYDSTTGITFEVRNVAAFRSLILNFAEHVEVIEPAAVRADMVRWLEALT